MMIAGISGSVVSTGVGSGSDIGAALVAFAALGAWAGRDVQLRFFFDSRSTDDDGTGWLLDDMGWKDEITCVRCHGISAAHANDEDIGATPPDITFKRTARADQ